MPVVLSPRLLTAVPYIRNVGLVADIGTDHAYLPIYLCESGRLSASAAPCAIAADIHRGPVERASLHIAAAGLSGRIRTVQTNGLTGLDVYDPADIIVFGMGGELIAAILAAAPWAHVPTREGFPRRFILQPMTHADRLRAYLSAAGLTIVAETLSREGERIYQTLCAETASGENARPLTLAELAVGQARHRGGGEQMALYRALIEKTAATESAARSARASAGLDVSGVDAFLASLSALRASIS